MKRLLDELEELEEIDKISGVRIGSLISTEEPDNIIVDYPDNMFGPLRARSTVSITLGEYSDVLLIFENEDPRLPIIIGIIKNKAVLEPSSNDISLDKKDINDIIMDGEKVIFKAQKEIELRCGQCSLIMRNDGKVIIRGTEILSRASRTNKIKGAIVDIN